MNTLLDFPCFLHQIGVLSSDLKHQLCHHDNVDNEHQIRLLKEVSDIDQHSLDYYLSEWSNTATTALDEVDPECVSILPEKICRRFQVLPFSWAGDTLCVAVKNPLDEHMLSTIAQLIQSPYRLYLAKQSTLDETIGRLFRKTKRIERFAKSAKNMVQRKHINNAESDDIDLLDNKASVVNLIDHLMQDAAQCQATDIHIESNYDHLIYYYRVGHESSEPVSLPNDIADMLVQRLIVMGDGDIAQRKLPQDLSFSFKKQDSTESINVRLSILFTLSGYSIVMRLLLSETGIFPLEELLTDPSTCQTISDFLRNEHGMMLVTGPTASGKTTLLYSLLKRIQDGHKKIISIEDPVEIQFSHLNQVQINPEIGLGFAEVIRSSLRQNPDVMMIGEIRDKESANMALRSAITGVLVFSTLHTPNTVRTIVRLVDLGADPFLIGSALKLTISTRLLRRVCPHCASAPRSLTDDEKRLLQPLLSEHAHFSITEGKGCDKCAHTGTKGLVLIAERLLIDESLQELIVQGDMDAFSKQAYATLSGRQLADQAKALAVSGEIPVNELIKLVCDV